jgi:hypothetical protein
LQIFLLSEDSAENASWYMDKHVVKTPAVIAHLLLNACARMRMKFPDIRSYGGMPIMPKQDILNNPFVKWATVSSANFNSFIELGLDLCKEYRLRFHANHYMEPNILAFNPIDTLLEPNFARYPCMVPAAYWDKKAFVTTNYKRYYIEVKNHLAVWTAPRDVPPWYPLEAVIEGRKIAQSFVEAKSKEGVVIDAVHLKLESSED